ncbi:50S ribosomal protein L1 [Candidatus Bathyarchaeota archaeon]|nr:MAG: 50S ribosomal protein L1 [Candidatus Bathyarchaeota archaeon]RLI04797.1 MAG: 50S ribosomal protein L1 [Candidatus Bathyarchaeota archaeon]
MSIEINNIKSALKEAREKSKKRNFNQSVELIINLRDVDVKKPENRIQETIELPHALDKKVGVCVFANGDMALRARRAGADMVLESADIEGLMNNKKRQREIAKSINSFIAAAPLMPLIGRVFGPILGPRGKMPTPVPPTANIEELIERHRRIVRVRARDQPVIHCRVGTESMSDDEIAENIQTVIRRVTRRLRRGIKNVDSIYVKMTMGPAVKVNI